MVQRQAQYPINDIFTKRWSPRAMSGEEITDSELFTLFEAARWAPSSSNNQPWTFYYAKRGSEHWETYLNLLMEGNRVWAQKASALVIIVSHKISTYKDRPIKTHSFDAGAAWMSLALQGSMSNLVIHGIGGFDYDKAAEFLELDNTLQVEAMCVIGKPGDAEDLPENLQEREVPSDRKPVSEIIINGKK